MTRFTYFFIDRPIFASVLSILIIIAGILSLFHLPITQYPEIAPPSVQVRAVFPGANPKVLAETVAAPIEQEVNGVEDLLYLSSQSTSDGVMQLTLTFRPGTNLDKVQMLVQNRVALAEPRLPEEVRRQGISVRKRSPDLSLVINLTSPDRRYDNSYMSNYALLQIKDTLARIHGVGDITLFGGREYSMRIWLDPEKVAARHLTAQDVVQAIREQNFQVAAGVIGQPPISDPTAFQYTVTTQGRLTEPEAFGEIILKSGSTSQVTRLKEVARIELASKDYSSELLLDGEATAGIAIFQMPGTNAIETKKAVVAAMETLKQRFPEGLTYQLVYDTVVFIQQSIEKVVETLFHALILVVIVVLLFLQTWRATLIPILAVPVSLIGTFAVMAWLGVSLNTLSLFGLVLAIGIVVDDAIVVVENVERQMACGKRAREATQAAMEEVVGPILATAIVLVAVFVPTAFISGVPGAFFKQFGLTISVSTVISAFNSLTLSPALCAWLLDRDHAAREQSVRGISALFRWVFKWFNHYFETYRAGYVWLTRRTLRIGLLLLVGYLLFNTATVSLFRTIPTGFIPAQDQGYLIIYAQLPDAASLERTKAVIREATTILLHTEGVKHVNAYAGFSVLSFSMQSNAGSLFARLTPFDERTGHPHLQSEALINTLQKKLSTIKDAYIAVFAPPPVRGLSTVGGFKLHIQDRSNVGAEALEQVVNDIVAKGNALPGMARVFTSFRASVPQLHVNVDRTVAKSMGVDLEDAFDTLRIYLGSAYVNDVTLFGRTYQVIAQADAPFRAIPQDITALKTRNRNGEMVPMSTLATVQETTGPDRISRYNLFPSAELNGLTQPDISSGQAIAMMDRLLRAELPASFGYEWTELSLQQILAGDTTLSVFVLSVLFAFLALAAQYESWSLPLAVILIVPTALLSAMLGVWWGGMDNNLFTQVGCIVLVGLASKNAILIVEFARRQQERGWNRYDAALEAAKLRLRPILMTSLAFIMGVFPLVTSTGAGAEARRILGTAVFSGMIGVTLFGLLFTPVFYVLVRTMVERGK